MLLARKLIKLLIKKKLTIGSVESVTGGCFISKLIKIPNASKVVVGSLITYQSSLKISLLNIKKKEIDKYGVVSETIANEMVKKGFSILNSDITVAFTGNAGPKKEKGDALIGRVYIAIFFKTFNKIKKFTKLYLGTRIKNIKDVANDAMNLIFNELNNSL